ncbi:MAG: NADH-quinone oxidoreductase subunit NuoK [Bacteroidales bacterium]|nr:NADH-quinone oxidoreductase subunit NuoK [Bacteroidales bacterium]MDD4603185.1 NADH-quinone oxidoreductase subunit NuoK [Bacteroidales bacterium]
MFEGVPLQWFLVTGTIMFFVGIYGFLVRKNLITILMSIELILNSVNINFVAFNKILYPGHLEGMFFTIFVIAVAAAETSVAIAIIINIYRRIVNIDVEKMNEMKY